MLQQYAVSEPQLSGQPELISCCICGPILTDVTQLLRACISMWKVGADTVCEYLRMEHCDHCDHCD